MEDIQGLERLWNGRQWISTFFGLIFDLHGLVLG
jgi:hypothetical protein